MTYTHDDYLKDCELVEQHYNGNREQEQRDRKKLHSIMLSWSDIETYAKVYPEHAQQAQQAIENRLGYLPCENIIIPHEVFIRTLIEQQYKGLISPVDYKRELDTHIRHIRNDDMNRFGWADKVRYAWAEISHYNNYLPQFEAMAHAKFVRFFGELPPLDYMIPADMMLRGLWAQHPDIITEGFTPFDYKAFTIVAYRRLIIEQGKEAADNSPTLGGYNP